MAAHQDYPSVAQRRREIAPVVVTGNQQVRVAELVMDVPNRRHIFHAPRRMQDRAQRHIGDREGDHVIGMIVHDRVYVGTRFEDRTMDGPLDIFRPGVVLHRIAVEMEFHDVLGLDQLGTA